MANLDHLSYSSISSYLLCGYQWKLHYIDKIQVPTSAPLVFGSAFHETVEKIVATPGDVDVDEIWREEWAKQLESPRNQGEFNWGDSSETDQQLNGTRLLHTTAIQKAIAAIKANYDQEAEVCDIERRVELAVPGVPIPIIGYIDVITKDGIPGDLKTAARMWSANKASEELQPLFYLSALNQAGVSVPDWKFRHYVFTKNSRPSSKTFEVQHRPSELFWLFEMIQSAWEGIKNEIYLKNPTGWKCNPKYCDYWDMCRGKYA